MNELTYAGEGLLDRAGSRWVNPWGVRPGRGIFYCDGRTLQRIQQYLADNAGCADLVLTDGVRELTLHTVYLVATRVIFSAVGQGATVYEIELADGRILWRNRSITGRYNIFKPDCKNYRSETINGSSPWTWQEIIDKLGLGLVLPASPSSTPGNIVWNGNSVAEELEAILNRLGLYLVWDFLSGPAIVAQTASGGSAVLAAIPQEFYREGGPALRIALPTAPATVEVRFPLAFLSGEKADEAMTDADRWYDIEVAAPEGVSVVEGSGACLFWNDCYALDDGGEITNDEDLAWIADEVVTAFYRPWRVQAGDYELAGLHPLSPDGAIRRVIWLNDPSGARTFVRVHDPSLGDDVEPGTGDLVEGRGILVQPARRSRRIETVRKEFWGKVVEASGSLWTIRVLDGEKTETDLTFDAYNMGPDDPEIDEIVLVVTDGEGRFCFHPFEESQLPDQDWITFGNPYVIRQAGSTEQTSIMYNAFYTANHEERMLFKSPTPFGSGNPYFWGGVSGGWPGTNDMLSLASGSDGVFTYTGSIALLAITEDYNPATLSWANQPAVQLITQVDFAGAFFWQAFFHGDPNIQNWTLSLFSMLGSKTTPPNTTTCYGFEVRAEGSINAGASRLMNLKLDLAGAGVLKWPFA